MKKIIDPMLPTIGILIFEEFLANEVVAPVDVFSRKDMEGNSLFNVVLVGKEDKVYLSEEGMKILPDFTISDAPKLNVLVVPGSNHPERQSNDETIIHFIRRQNETTDYIASHCAGAFILGSSGVADDKKMVTYCSGAEKLQNDYPRLLVMDDTMVAVVQDGKIISSNGNLVSYLASLDLLQEMSSKEHRKFVEQQLLMHKLAAHYSEANTPSF